MSDRRREVVAEYSTYYVCDVHGWDYTDIDDDVCPVCMGESLMCDRIVKVLEDRLQEVTLPDGALFIESTVIKQIIKLIKEKTNEQ